MIDKLSTDFYKKYVGKYAKRFYTPFTKGTIFYILGFKIIYNDLLEKDIACFVMDDNDDHIWNWDVEDCVIITDEVEEDDERVVSIHNKEYKGFNPYKDGRCIS